MPRAIINPFTSYLDEIGLLSDDPSPTLMGDLNMNGYSIISNAGQNIPITPGAGGQIVLAGEHWPLTDGAANTVLTTNGAGILSWSAFAPGSFNWVIVTSADNPVTLADLTGYIVKGGAQVIFKLPAAAALGLNAKIVGYGNLWTIQQNAGQSIRLGAVSSTAGVGGSFTASMVSDCLEILCVTANTEFFCPSSIGNPVIV